MARKSAPGTLIHCDACGEDYSATYKRCPFCGEKPDKKPAASLPPQGDYEDDYVFDGSDVFEEEPEQETSAHPKGGKRLAQEDAPGPINWPRLITFICSLVIIAAALVIVFAFIYPKIHNPSPDPGNTNSVVSPAPESMPPVESDPVAVTDDPNIGSTDDPSSEPPSQEPTPPADTTVTGLSLNKSDFTLTANESYTIQATVTPADWGGTVSWTSSNTSIATVSANGTVTNVNTGSSLRSVTITATAGSQSATATVYCRGGSSGNAAPSSNPSGGALTLNREDFTLVLSSNQTFTMKATGADSVTWSIANSSIATISDSGVVTPVAAGQTTITATASDGRTATCIVRVKN